MEKKVDLISFFWCLLISSIILSLTALATSVLRSIVKYNMINNIYVYCLLDLLCGLELCVCGLELSVVLDICDVTCYCVVLWVVLVWQAISWGEASPKPYSHLLSWQAGSQSAVQSVVRAVAGAAGALSSYQVLKQVWGYEFSMYHEGRAELAASGFCADDLQVSLISGTIIELIGTLICFLSSYLLCDLPQLQFKPLLTTCLDKAVCVAIAMAASDLTGGYFNPAMALGTKLGCGTGGIVQHIVVYWVGPCVGASMAGPVYGKVKAALFTVRDVIKKLDNEVTCKERKYK